MHSNKFISTSWATLIVFTICIWLSYLPLLESSFPGFYPAAVIFGSPVFFDIFIISLLVSVFFIIAIPCILITAYLFQRRISRKISNLIAIMLLIPALSFAFSPSFIGCKPYKSLTVSQWQRTYHLAYTAVQFDDTYGNTLLFQCDLTGIFCHRIHSIYGPFNFPGSLDLLYDPGRDQLRLQSHYAYYIRSQQDEICAVDSETAIQPCLENNAK